MFRSLTTAFLVATLALCEGTDKNAPKDYPLALEISTTTSINSAHDHSIAKASDGNLYLIACADRSGSSRFRAAVKAMENEKDESKASTVPDCGGVTLVPGVIYRARWDKGRLKIQISEPDKASKPKESTYTVINSQKMTADEERDCKACMLDKEQ